MCPPPSGSPSGTRMAGTLSGQSPTLVPWLQTPLPSVSTASAEAFAPFLSEPTEALTEANPPQEASLHPFNNPSLPPIPKRLLKAIKAGRYVDLGDLLPETLAEAFDSAVKEGKEDKPSKKAFPINTPLDWGLAYATFASASTHFYPARAQQLLAYSGIIFRLARKVGGNAWQRYDSAFRQAAAVNPSLQWDRREPDTWLASLAEDTRPKRPPPDPQTPPRKKSTFSTIKACIRWNRGNCHSTMCCFAHECLVCQSTFHGAKDCPILQPNTATRKATPSFGGTDKDIKQ